MRVRPSYGGTCIVAWMRCFFHRWQVLHCGAPATYNKLSAVQLDPAAIDELLFYLEAKIAECLAFRPVCARFSAFPDYSVLFWETD